ncbi:hypothetical protein AAFF_G00351810 [Aldrovandia affinis]|uniref:Uncharacterized protein n=1 Tax=Aldrovandia affinis TaxID=143900 RepID=A0AAD7WPB9_9TELE|nr:hypothetical protein AAFF_G00351810 [Aldrovandia affinis]
MVCLVSRQFPAIGVTGQTFGCSLRSHRQLLDMVPGLLSHFHLDGEGKAPLEKAFNYRHSRRENLTQGRLDILLSRDRDKERSLLLFGVSQNLSPSAMSALRAAAAKMESPPVDVDSCLQL